MANNEYRLTGIAHQLDGVLRLRRPGGEQEGEGHRGRRERTPGRSPCALRTGESEKT